MTSQVLGLGLVGHGLGLGFVGHFLDSITAYRSASSRAVDHGGGVGEYSMTNRKTYKYHVFAPTAGARSTIFSKLCTVIEHTRRDHQKG